MNKKILFIQPTIYDDNCIPIKKSRLYFIGLAYPLLAALTPPEWSVEICLETIEDIPFDTDADLIGIGGMGHAANRGKDIALEFKKLGKTVIMGGPMASLAPELLQPFCDAVVIGDAENIWLDLLTDYCAGTLKKAYQSDIRQFSYPIPRYDLVLKKKIGDFLPVQAGRGCPNSCNFCSIFCLYRTKYFRRDIDEVIRDIKHIKSLGFKKFLLLDDNIISERDYMLKLCREIKKLDMHWMSQCAIDIARDPELLQAVAESGCDMLSFGLESISPESLKLLEKTWCKPEEYLSLLNTVAASGIDVASEMIIGVDTDTRESIERTVEFILKSPIRTPRFFILTPIPGTDMFKRMFAEGRIITRDFYSITASKAVITHPNFSTEELDELYWSVYDRIYTLGNILKRTIFHKTFFKHPARNIFFLVVNLFYRYQIKKRIAPIIM